MAGRVVEVTWLDAARGEDSPPSNPVTYTRRTVGWLMSNTPEGVVVAFTQDERGDIVDYERWFSVPRAHVKRVRTLK